jgi:hypothetical protein
MPAARSASSFRSRIPIQIWALGLALLANACSGDRPTEPIPDKPHASTSEDETAGFLQDDFTDADGTILQNHTPDGGAVPFSWVEGPDWGPPEALIQDNAVIARPGFDWAYTTSVPTGDWAEVDIEVLADAATTGAGQDIVLWMRTDHVGLHDGYEVYRSIGPNVNMVAVYLADASYSYSFPDKPKLGLQTFRAEINARGEMEVSVDGQLVLTAPLGPLQPPAKTGLGFWTGGSPTVRLTSFRAAAIDAPEVRIQSATGSMTVWPKKTAGPASLDVKVGVYDAEGSPVPNRSVTLALTPIERSAGHDHDGSKPTGAFLPQNPIQTGSSGETVVKYTAPDPSGPVVISGVSPGAREAAETISVAVPGLVTIERTGEHHTFESSSKHSSNDFYMAPGTMGVMKQIWQRYVDKGYPRNTAKKFRITAAALISGGLYDWKGTWAPPHSTHRQGGDMDFNDEVAELHPDDMAKVCAKFPFGGRRVVCELHDGNHFHAFIGPNR